MENTESLREYNGAPNRVRYLLPNTIPNPERRQEEGMKRCASFTDIAPVREFAAAFPNLLELGLPVGRGCASICLWLSP